MSEQAKNQRVWGSGYAAGLAAAEKRSTQAMSSPAAAVDILIRERLMCEGCKVRGPWNEDGKLDGGAMSVGWYVQDGGEFGCLARGLKLLCHKCNSRRADIDRQGHSFHDGPLDWWAGNACLRRLMSLLLGYTFSPSDKDRLFEITEAAAFLPDAKFTP